MLNNILKSEHYICTNRVVGFNKLGPHLQLDNCSPMTSRCFNSFLCQAEVKNSQKTYVHISFHNQLLLELPKISHWNRELPITSETGYLSWILLITLVGNSYRRNCKRFCHPHQHLIQIEWDLILVKWINTN